MGGLGGQRCSKLMGLREAKGEQEKGREGAEEGGALGRVGEGKEGEREGRDQEKNEMHLQQKTFGYLK